MNEDTDFGSEKLHENQQWKLKIKKKKKEIVRQIPRERRRKKEL